MNDLLAIGSSALRTSRAALAVTGDNVANAQTPGFARRALRIEEVRLGAGASPLYRNRLNLDGSEPGAIVRISDAFRVAEARATGADDAATQALSRWLATGEAALGDTVAPALANVFATGARLAATPGDTSVRLSFLGKIDDLATSVRNASDALARTTMGIAETTSAALGSANADLAALGTLNLAIGRQVAGTSAFVELEDQRDQLLDRIAAATGATIIVAPDGTARVTNNGSTVVDWGAVVPLTGAAQGGALAGLTAAATATTRQSTDLDALARDIASTFNDWSARGGGPALLGGIRASELRLATNDPAAIAAGDATSDNNNALALADLRTTSALEARASQMTQRQSTATAAARTAAEGTAARYDAASAARDAIEGIDLDREAADLLRHQQSYQAAAKIIQAAKDSLDTILALFR